MIIGVDIGGTFTDFVLYDGELHSFKLPTDPAAPESAVLQGLQQIGLGDDAELVHGSTVATNAVLERRGARTAFVASKGFRDLLTIGRQNRSELYDLFADRPEPLIPPELCFEVEERLDHHGHALQSLDEDDLARLAIELRGSEVESIAVCLLFSFLNPQHEQRVANKLESLGVPVSISSQVLPEFREYERGSTTALNAYVQPTMSDYLSRLEAGLEHLPVRIMQSNGGSLSAAQTRLQPVRSILSGPAGGVIGALSIARQAGFERLVAFDMGGTSTDVSLSTGEPPLTSEGAIDGLPLRVPMIDIHTIGSGGGSIASVDPGGSLRVGPRSSGADPGPACYRKGGREPTVTDANLVLQRLDPERFLGGKMALDPRAAEGALDRLGTELGYLPGPTRARQAALGVIAVANAHMARALRVVSVERGHDPRDFTLLSFGGAGGLHACAVARAVGIRQVLIPPIASTLSAFGMIVADIKRDFVQTVMLDASAGAQELAGHVEPVMARARAELEREGIPAKQIDTAAWLDLRYAGQAYELTLPLGEDWVERFHQAHEQQYGYHDPHRPVQIVNVRVQAISRSSPLEHSPAVHHPSTTEPYGAPAYLGEEAERPQAVMQYDGTALAEGTSIDGPALIYYPDTTVLIGATDRLRVDSHRNLLVSVEPL